MPLQETWSYDQNGAVAEANSVAVDLAAFNAKARTSAALQHVIEAEMALNNMEYPAQGVAMGLNKARQSLVEGW